MSIVESTLPAPPPPPPDPPGPPYNSVRGNDRRRDRKGLRYVLSTAAIAIAAVVSLAWFDNSPLAIIPFLFLIVVPFEKLFPRHKGQRVRRAAAGTDVAYALSTPLLQFVGLLVAIPIALASLIWIPGLMLRPLVAMIHPSVTPFVGIALFDMAIYWVHRWSHEVPFFWKFHSIHHSPESMDWISGFRNHPFDGAIIAPPFVFLLAAGFSAEFTGIVAVVQIVLGLFLHANVRWRLRPLHRLVITPEFHHWHHANEPDAINTNYSVFLPLWDMIFGTYYMPKDKRPRRYGVSQYVPSGIAAQLRYPLRGMVSPLRIVRHPAASLKRGWRFTGAILGDMRRSTFRTRSI